MDRRTLIAIALSFGILLAWQKLYLEPRMPQQTQQTQQTAAPQGQHGASTATTTEKAPAPGTAAVSQPTGKSAARPAEKKPLVTALGAAEVADTGKIFSDWTLKSYRTGATADAPPISLQNVNNLGATLELGFDDQSLAYAMAAQGAFSSTAQGLSWSYEDQNLRLTREFSATENQAYVDLTLRAEFKTARPKYAFVSLASQAVKDDPEAQDRQVLYFTNNSLERINVEKSKLTEVATDVKYVGVQNRYFVMTALSRGETQPKGLVQPLGETSARVSLVYPVSGSSLVVPLRVYFGPKELDTLRGVDPTLDHTVDFGWFTAFAYPLLRIMKFLYGIIRNYGVAIIILTLLLKVITYPLTYKSMKSMKEMAKIQPQLQRIREKHKDDKEALNREMLTLMKGHGYNPMAGCVPVLIQMPIFIALYKVLYGSIELFHAPFALWINDLAAKDPFYVTPVLLTATMFLQQKLQPNTATDPAQQKMMQFMPVIFGVMMINLPSGLTLYMLVNALASIAQQLILNKKLA